jgi:hypothetical protein
VRVCGGGGGVASATGGGSGDSGPLGLSWNGKWRFLGWRMERGYAMRAGTGGKEGRYGNDG